MASSEMPDTNIYLYDPWADEGDLRGSECDENGQPPDDSTTFDRDDSFDDGADNNGYDVFDPVDTYETIEQRWTWAGHTQDMCTAGFWAPNNLGTCGCFGLSSSNLRDEFTSPEKKDGPIDGLQ